MSTVAYRPLTQAEQIFKSLVWDPMIKAGEVWIAGAEATVPVLDLGIVQGLEDAALTGISDWIYSTFVLLVDVTAIQLVNTAHQAAYDAASEKLAVIADEQGITSDAFQQAQSAALADLAQFVHIGP